jgi:hypothetical protein
MAHAYTTGLRIAEDTVIRKERRLPLKGSVLVAKGDPVRAEDVVARTELPGEVASVNVASKLGLLPEEVLAHMTKHEGDPVQEGEVIAASKGLMGLFKSEATAPAAGTIESISSVTGQVLIRRPPVPVDVIAYVAGTVSEVYEGEGVQVETHGTFIQGIFGIGGEAIGDLAFRCGSPDEVLDADSIGDDAAGKVVVGGRLVTGQALRRAVEVGAKAVVTGGIHDRDLEDFLGRPLGVAITGFESVGLTLVVTEGFGEVRMADRTFELLKAREGMKASVNGATQIRAGVIRPEVVVPLPGPPSGPEPQDETEQGVKVGDIVRIIRDPYFGLLARVTDLPAELARIDTEAEVRIVELELEKDGTRVRIPRANIELIRQ